MQVTRSVETLLGTLGAPGAETEFSVPIASRTVERWACDCSLTRVLMQDAVDGQPPCISASSCAASRALVVP